MEVNPDTGDRQVVVSYQRRPASAYMTQTLEPLLPLFQCNSNAQLILDDRIGFYIFHYVTKRNTRLDQTFQGAMDAATRNYARHLQRPGVSASSSTSTTSSTSVRANGLSAAESESNLARDRVALQGLSRLMSAVNGHTQGEIIGAPLAAWVLLGHPIFMFGSSFQFLPLYQAAVFFENGLVPISIARSREIQSHLVDYLHRGEPLLHLTWYDFVRRYVRVRIRRQRSSSSTSSRSEGLPLEGEAEADDADAAEQAAADADPEQLASGIAAGGVPFRESHPRHATHYMALRHRLVVPMPLMTRLPDWVGLSAAPLTAEGLAALRQDPALSHPPSPARPDQIAETRALQEKYGQYALLLSFPFVYNTVWRQPGESWWQAFLRRSVDLTPFALLGLQREQNYHEAFARNAADIEEALGAMGVNGDDDEPDERRDEAEALDADQMQEADEENTRLTSAELSETARNLQHRLGQVDVSSIPEPRLPPGVQSSRVDVTSANFQLAMAVLDQPASFANRFAPVPAVPSSHAEIPIPLRQMRVVRPTQVIAFVASALNRPSSSSTSSNSSAVLPADRPGIYDAIAQYQLGEGPQQECFTLYACTLLLELLTRAEEQLQLEPSDETRAQLQVC